jgi:peroxiredoxin
MLGGQAPDFDLPSLDGGRQSLDDLLANGPVLLAFYKGACPTCQLTFPFLQRLQQGKAAGTPQIVAISQDDARATTDFNRRYGITFTTLLDPPLDGALRYPASSAYRIANVPTLFLIEADGRISEYFAAFDKAGMERLGQRFGVEIFTATDRVPVFRPG